MASKYEYVSDLTNKITRYTHQFEKKLILVQVQGRPTI